MIGITGTDGKTTTANILQSILRENGVACGLLSTLRAVIGAKEEPLALHVTTPEAPQVQRYLRRMVNAGMTHCILEATSHGLAQHRVAAIDFDVAIVTNVTHEHLDYHGSWQEYLAAKRRLFAALTQDSWPHSGERAGQAFTKTAILNGDDASLPYFQRVGCPRELIYGLDDAYDVSASKLQFSAAATRFILHFPADGDDGRRLEVESPLVGDFNVYNMLAAAAAAHCLGVSGEGIRRGLRRVPSLSGRMERIDAGQPFLVVVDFAHTPNGLAKAIAAGRRLAPDGKLITVFGSAGKRDVEKRRLMAAISTREANMTLLTAEDPRTESLAEILSMMAEGCREAGGIEGENFWRIPDRGRAIYHAAQHAKPGDLILICGKGHEQSMCFGVTEYEWDDAFAARAVLAAFLSHDPPPDLGLPTFEE